MTIFKVTKNELFTDYKLFFLNFRKYNHNAIYKELRKNQDCAWFGYKLLSFCNVNECLQATGQQRQIQIDSLQLLKKIVRIVEINNLKYWLDYSSLLGLKRCNGFIPWEKKTNISMLRCDFLSLKEYLANNIAELSLSYSEKCSYTKYFLEIRDKATGAICIVTPVEEILLTNNLNCLSELLAIRLQKLKNFLKSKRTISHQEFYDIVDKLKVLNSENKFQEKNKYIIYYSDFSLLRQSILIPYDVIFDLTKEKFEEEFFCVPKDYKKLLIGEYNNVDSYPSLLRLFENSIEMEKYNSSYPIGIKSQYNPDIRIEYITPEIRKAWGIK